VRGANGYVVVKTELVDLHIRMHGNVLYDRRSQSIEWNDRDFDS
jgi:hypothetical protein